MCPSWGGACSLPKSTVHRLLSILVNEGFVERTADERYRLSLKLYEIGQEVVSSRVLRQVGHVPLEKLHNDSNEATHLAVLSGPDVVYLDRLESPQMMGLFTRVGRRRSAHATSSGKVLLAFGSQADVDDAVAARAPPPRPAHHHHPHPAEPGIRRGSQGRLRDQHRRGRAWRRVDRRARSSTASARASRPCRSPVH